MPRTVVNHQDAFVVDQIEGSPDVIVVPYQHDLQLVALDAPVGFFDSPRTLDAMQIAAIDHGESGVVDEGVFVQAGPGRKVLFHAWSIGSVGRCSVGFSRFGCFIELRLLAGKCALASWSFLRLSLRASDGCFRHHDVDNWGSCCCWLSKVLGG